MVRILMRRDSLSVECCSAVDRGLSIQAGVNTCTNWNNQQKMIVRGKQSLLNVLKIVLSSLL